MEQGKKLLSISDPMMDDEEFGVGGDQESFKDLGSEQDKYEQRLAEPYKKWLVIKSKQLEIEKDIEKEKEIHSFFLKLVIFINTGGALLSTFYILDEFYLLYGFQMGTHVLNISIFSIGLQALGKRNSSLYRMFSILLFLTFLITILLIIFGALHQSEQDPIIAEIFGGLSLISSLVILCQFKKWKRRLLEYEENIAKLTKMSQSIIKSHPAIDTATDPR